MSFEDEMVESILQAVSSPISGPDDAGRPNLLVLTPRPEAIRLRIESELKTKPIPDRLSFLRGHLGSSAAQLPPEGFNDGSITLSAGNAIGPTIDSGGTIGAVLVDTQIPQNQYLLTARHVFGVATPQVNADGTGDVLVAATTGNEGYSYRRGRLFATSDLTSVTPTGDWALVLPGTRVLLEVSSPCETRRVIHSSAAVSLLVGDVLFKCGASTGRRMGQVQDVQGDLLTLYPVGTSEVLLTFSDHILVGDIPGLATFAGAGDSGSLVYRETSSGELEAVGMLIVVSKDQYLVTPLATILADIKAETGLDLKLA